MGLRAGVEFCGKSRPTGIRSPDRPARRYTDYATRPTQGSYNLVQNRGHRGRVLRPSCIGPGEDPYPIYHSVVFFMAGENIKNGALCGSINGKQNGWRN